MCGLFFSWTVEELRGDGNINIRICFRFNDPQSRFSQVSPSTYFRNKKCLIAGGWAKGLRAFPKDNLM